MEIKESSQILYHWNLIHIKNNLMIQIYLLKSKEAINNCLLCFQIKNKN
jgi:hypothetical protein